MRWSRGVVMVVAALFRGGGRSGSSRAIVAAFRASPSSPAPRCRRPPARIAAYSSASNYASASGRAPRTSLSMLSSSSSPPPSAATTPPTATIPTPLPATPYDDGVSPYEITTPIYYVNDKPHIGHAYTSVACDVVARYMRLSGRRVFFLSGTDEHGQKVQESAARAGVDPQEFCDTVSTQFRDLLTTMDVSNDAFVRTTDAGHKDAVRHLWRTLRKNGAIYLGSYEGWYSVRDECYYNESELVDGKAPTGADVEWVKKENSYFFRLSDYQDRLLEHYDNNPDFIAPEARRNEALSFVRGGLRDLSVSRTSFDWGVPVPDSEDDDPGASHVMYVWVDALANYISALGYPHASTSGTESGSGSSDEASDFATFWPASLHVVGKDILRFHAVYWPALLMAAELPLPRRIFAHGWWTKDGEKISKSLGNVIDPLDLVETYGVDPTRFFLMADVTFGSDGDFSHEKIIYKVNANLANELGNLCQRILALVYNNCDGAVPAPEAEEPYTADDLALLARSADLRSETAAFISRQALHKYVDVVGDVVRDANKYIDVQAPWALKKSGDLRRMDTVLYVLLETVRKVAILYQPLMPTSSAEILDQMNVPGDERTFGHLDGDGFAIRPGTAIGKPSPVFPRIEIPESIVAGAGGGGAGKKQKQKKKDGAKKQDGTKAESAKAQ